MPRKKEKLLAVPYGADGLMGDSAFFPSRENAVRATEKSTLEELRAAWTSDDEEPGEIAGFWILTERDLDVALIPADEIECGNDTQTYTVNRVVKTLCNRLAKRTVGDLSPLIGR